MSVAPILLEKLQALLDDVRRRLYAGEDVWAVGRLQRLIHQGVKSPDVYRLLALALLKCARYDEATAALQDARAVGTNAATEVAFGRFLNAERHKEAALNCFQYAIQLDPENED